MRVSPDEFRALDLEVHRVLSDVPLHDVSAIDLPGGGPGRTVSDVRALADDAMGGANAAVRGLFALRFWLGRVFGWDAEERGIRAHAADSYVHRIDPELRRRSRVAPGSKNGHFHDLYVLERESLAEIRNATVHGFLDVALVDAAGGYRLYWGVYVKPVSRWTRAYMTGIEPFRRFVVYPVLLRRIRRGWQARYPSPPRS